MSGEFMKHTFVVVLLVCIGTISSQRKVSRHVPVGADVKQTVDFDCPEEFGYYPHPTDCTQYYVCVFGGALLESCTGGLMYSHELQTCDWPRNVGCDASGVSGSSSSSSDNQQQVQQSTGSRGTTSRYSAPPPPVAVTVSSRGQPRQLHHQVQVSRDEDYHISKVRVTPTLLHKSRASRIPPDNLESRSNIKQRQHQQQLYAEAEADLPPVEEIESDRQQRVYRGQPSTVGQVQRDRDALRHSNAIPTSNIRSAKIGVISFGTQQQQSSSPHQDQQYSNVTGELCANGSDQTLTPVHDLNRNGHILNRIRRQIQYSRLHTIGIPTNPAIRYTWTAGSSPVGVLLPSRQDFYQPSESKTNKSPRQDFYITNGNDQQKPNQVATTDLRPPPFRPSLPDRPYSSSSFESSSDQDFKPFIPNYSKQSPSAPVHTILPLIHRTYSTQAPSFGNETNAYTFVDLNPNKPPAIPNKSSNIDGSYSYYKLGSTAPTFVTYNTEPVPRLNPSEITSPRTLSSTTSKFYDDNERDTDRKPQTTESNFNSFDNIANIFSPSQPNGDFRNSDYIKFQHFDLKPPVFVQESQHVNQYDDSSRKQKQPKNINGNNNFNSYNKNIPPNYEDDRKYSQNVFLNSFLGNYDDNETNHFEADQIEQPHVESDKNTHIHLSSPSNSHHYETDHYIDPVDSQTMKSQKTKYPRIHHSYPETYSDYEENNRHQTHRKNQTRFYSSPNKTPTNDQEANRHVYYDEEPQENPNTNTNDDIHEEYFHDEFTPPPDFFNNENKYENIVNPFADPDFDFDKYIAGLRDSHLSFIETTTTSPMILIENESFKKTTVDIQTPRPFKPTIHTERTPIRTDHVSHDKLPIRSSTTEHYDYERDAPKHMDFYDYNDDLLQPMRFNSQKNKSNNHLNKNHYDLHREQTDESSPNNRYLAKSKQNQRTSRPRTTTESMTYLSTKVPTTSTDSATLSPTKRRRPEQQSRRNLPTRKYNASLSGHDIDHSNTKDNRLLDEPNRVEPSTLAPEQYAPSRPVSITTAGNTGRALYNASQQYEPNQYDPYYPAYDDDVELYRDVDYGHNYNTATINERPKSQTQYRGTAATPQQSIESITVSARNPSQYIQQDAVQYNISPQQNLYKQSTVDDYADESDPSGFQHSSGRQPLRGDRNELRIQEPTPTKQAVTTTTTTTTVQSKTSATRSEKKGPANATVPETIFITLTAKPRISPTPFQTTATPLLAHTDTSTPIPTSSSTIKSRFISLTAGYTLLDKDTRRANTGSQLSAPLLNATIMRPAPFSLAPQTNEDNNAKIQTQPVLFTITNLPAPNQSIIINLSSDTLGSTQHNKSRNIHVQTQPRSIESQNKRQAYVNTNARQQIYNYNNIPSNNISHTLLITPPPAKELSNSFRFVSQNPYFSSTQSTPLDKLVPPFPDNEASISPNGAIPKLDFPIAEDNSFDSSTLKNIHNSAQDEITTNRPSAENQDRFKLQRNSSNTINNSNITKELHATTDIHNVAITSKENTEGNLTPIIRVPQHFTSTKSPLISTEVNNQRRLPTVDKHNYRKWKTDIDNLYEKDTDFEDEDEDTNNNPRPANVSKNRSQVTPNIHSNKNFLRKGITDYSNPEPSTYRPHSQYKLRVTVTPPVKSVNTPKLHFTEQFSAEFNQKRTVPITSIPVRSTNHTSQISDIEESTPNHSYDPYLLHNLRFQSEAPIIPSTRPTVSKISTEYPKSSPLVEFISTQTDKSTSLNAVSAENTKTTLLGNSRVLRPERLHQSAIDIVEDPSETEGNNFYLQKPNFSRYTSQRFPVSSTTSVPNNIVEFDRKYFPETLFPQHGRSHSINVTPTDPTLIKIDDNKTSNQIPSLPNSPPEVLRTNVVSSVENTRIAMNRFTIERKPTTESHISSLSPIQNDSIEITTTFRLRNKEHPSALKSDDNDLDITKTRPRLLGAILAKTSSPPSSLEAINLTQIIPSTTPGRVSRINPAIKSITTFGGARGSFDTQKCVNNITIPNVKCNEIQQRTTVRGRGSAHYTSSGSNDDGITINRGTPPSRARPTLKPSTAIVSKASEFIDIYKFPANRPAPVYPTPQVDKSAAKCRKDVCLLPDCSCGGKDIPGGLSRLDTPQMVLITFDDAVNDLNKGLYSDLFEKGRVNPNGCPLTATFYVSHEWTDYSQVQNLYAEGHEMASHTVSHSFGEQFSQKKWNREVAGQREILSAYGGVRLEDVRGMRAPFLSVGGNKMFKMLYDSNFTYDSSMPVYENRPPSWPYTLDYKLFHDCMIPPCPTRSYPGVWEVPMVMWQDLNGGRCSMGDACSNPPTSDGVYKMLMKNFDRHYSSNRAPFGLFYHAAWFTQPHHKEGFINFLDTINAMKDVYLVTNWQAIQWVRDPTPLSRLGQFQPFQCDYPYRPKRCNNPKVCNLWHKSGVRYMRTCQPCPDIYPWTGKTGIRSSRIDNDIED